jgi:hypothetical protein
MVVLRSVIALSALAGFFSPALGATTVKINALGDSITGSPVRPNFFHFPVAFLSASEIHMSCAELTATPGLLAGPPLAKAPSCRRHQHGFRRHAPWSRLRLHLRRRERRARRLPSHRHRVQQTAARLAQDFAAGHRDDGAGYK